MKLAYGRGSITGWVVAVVAALLGAPAAAQNAANGYRLYTFTDTLKGTAQNCASCHGANPRTPPNAMLAIPSINPACGRTDWPVGTAHALKGLCAIAASRVPIQSDAEVRVAVGMAQPLMAQFAVLTAQERADIAAFLLASQLNPTFPPVPVARPEYRAEGATDAITTLDFGNVSEGAMAQRVVYFVNAGTAPMQIDASFAVGPMAISGLNPTRFSVSSAVPPMETPCAPNAPIAAGGRCGLTVSFSPDSAIAGGASQTATLTIRSNGGSGVAQLGLTGRRPVVPMPILTLNPAGTSINVGTTPVGTTVRSTPVTVTNTGNLNLNFTSITIGGANASEFARATGGVHCAPNAAVPMGGGTCTLEFSFSPPAGVSGTRSATVTLVSNAQGSPLTLNLTATVGTVTPSISFGTTSNTNQAFLRLQGAAVGAAVNGVVTIRNPGAAGAPTLTVTNIELSAGAPTFAIAPGATNCLSAPLPPGASCTVNVTYTPPNMAVPHSGNLRVISNGRTTAGSDSPHDVILEGTVIVPGSGDTTAQAPNAPPMLRFPNTPANVQSAAERINVNNMGSAALTVQARLAAGTSSDFTVLNNCTSIAAGSSCYLDVRFRPRGEGVRSDTLSLSYNGGTLAPVRLSGTGQAANLVGEGAGGGALSPAVLLALGLLLLAACGLRRRV